MSKPLLCIHYPDEQYKSLYRVTTYDYINMLIRIGIDLVVFVLVMPVIEWIKSCLHPKAACRNRSKR